MRSKANYYKDRFYLFAEPTTTYDEYRNNRYDDFQFTGFGANDPKRKRAFTAGTYVIQQGRWYVVGEYLDRRQLYNNGWYPERTSFQNIGILDANGNNNGRISLVPKEEVGLSTVIYNNAISKLYDQLRSSDLNLALTIGERKESARMIRKALEATASVVQMARKVRKQLVTNPSLLASNLWLQYKYGWLPLYNDVYAATEFHYHLFSERKFEAKAARNVEWSSKSPWSSMAGELPLKHKHGQRCQLIVYAGVADSDAYNLSRITSLNPLSIAWELVPFSFVADWFVDIGGYLANMEASLGTGLSFKRGMVTEVAYLETRSPGTSWEWWGTTKYSSTWWENRYVRSYVPKDENWCRKVTKTRTVLGNFPRPRFPVFKVSLGSQRIISAAALVRQCLLGGIRGRKW